MISEPAIDKRTEEKMFSGTLAPEDAPPEFARVAVLLRAAGLPRTGTRSGSLVSDSEKLRQEHVVAGMAAVIAAAPEGPPAAAPGHTLWKGMSASRPERAGGRRRGRARLVLVMAFAMMVAGASMAFAGVLPAPMQHAASVLFSKVGVHVPNGQGTGSGQEPGSRSGHEKVSGNGDHGKGTDHGKHNGQQKNGNRGLHKGQDKSHGGDHSHHGDGGQGQGHGGSDGHGSGGSGHDAGAGSSQGQNGGGHSGGGDSGGSGGSGSTSGGQSSGDSGHDGSGSSGHHSLEVATP